MRTITVAAGEAVQLNGPWFGLRVVDFTAGAAVRLNFGEPIPMVAAFAISAPPGQPFDRVNLTGRIIVQLAEAPDEDLGASVTAPPVTVGRTFSEQALFTATPGDVIPQGTISAWPELPKLTATVATPANAVGFDLIANCYFTGGGATFGGSTYQLAARVLETKSWDGTARTYYGAPPATGYAFHKPLDLGMGGLWLSQPFGGANEKRIGIVRLVSHTFPPGSPVSYTGNSAVGTVIAASLAPAYYFVINASAAAYTVQPNTAIEFLLRWQLHP